MFLFERRFCNWIVEYWCGSKKQRHFDVEDFRGTCETQSCSGLIGFYIFFFTFNSLRVAKWKAFGQVFRAFFIRETFSQSLHNPANIFPSFCLLCVPSPVVEISLFSWFFSREIHVQNNAQFASDCLISGCWLFLFRCIVPSSLRRSSQAEATMIHQR